MQNKNYPRVQIIINADSNEEIQDSVSWLAGTVKQSATEWPSESPASKVEKAAPKNIKSEGEAPDDVIHEKPVAKKDTPAKKDAKKTPEKSEGIKLTDLQKKMSAVLKLNKRDDAKALLAEFETPNLKGLDEDKYADFDKRLDDLLGGD